MKLEETIQRVQSLYSKGVQSQDSRLRPRQIYSALITKRATLLNQKINKRQPVSQWVYQTLPCVEMIPAAPNECPNVPMDGCMLLRSKHKLPAPITGLQGHAIQSITSMDGSLDIGKTTFATHKYNSGNKFTSKKARAFIHNGYLFLTVLKKLRVVTVVGLFHDFVEASRFPSACSDECIDCCESPLEMEFLLDSDDTDTCIQMTNNELINIFIQMKEDKNNDSSDNVPTQNMIH